MDKLQSMDIQVYRTDKQGTIVVTSDGTNLNWSAEPCNDYTPGDDSDQGTQSTSEVQQEASKDSNRRACMGVCDRKQIPQDESLWQYESEYGKRRNPGRSGSAGT